MRNLPRFLGVGAKSGTAAVSKNPKGANFTIPDVINFHDNSKRLCLGKFAEIQIKVISLQIFKVLPVRLKISNQTYLLSPQKVFRAVYTRRGFISSQKSTKNIEPLAFCTITGIYK